MITFKLDDAILKKNCEDEAKKRVLSIEDPEVVKEFLKYIQIQNEFMSSTSAYEISSIIRSFFTWYQNKDIEPAKSWATHREVYYVDLGAFNLKYEEGYMHPCLVVRKYGSSAIVIPGSTKKYGKSDPLIYDVQAGNGFKENTGLMLDQIRCVSTTRLICKLKYGKISPDVFSKIIERFMEKFLCKQYNDFDSLKKQNKKLLDKLVEIEKSNSILKDENKELKDQLESMAKVEQDA